MELKVGELEPDMDRVTVIGKIVELSEIREITTRDGRQTQLKDMILADETGQVYVPIWGERIENLDPAKVGAIIKIKYGYTKVGFNDQLSLNIGSSTTIEINPPGINISETKDTKVLTYRSSGDMPRIKIKDLNLVGAAGF